MRDKLIEILLEREAVKDANAYDRAESLADFLLEKGVIVLPCKVGETVYADIIHRRNGDFIDECEVKFIEFDTDWSEPLFTIICRDKATYRTYWASEFGKEFFKEPRFAEKKPSKKKGAQG